jgi:hypothetical protein
LLPASPSRGRVGGVFTLLLRAALPPDRRLAPLRVAVIGVADSLLVFAAVVGHWA